MEHVETRQRGRPPKVTRDGILAAAAQWEPERLQLTTLAQELGISAKALYYYFPTRQALLDALTDVAVEKMGVPSIADAPTWRAVLRENALWYYRLGLSHPGWFGNASGMNGARRVALRLMLGICDRLAEFGWSKHDAYRAHIVVSNWAIAKGEAAASSPGIGQSDEKTRRFLADYVAPATVEVLLEIVEPFQTDEELFEDGLTIVLSGIEREIVGGRG